MRILLWAGAALLVGCAAKAPQYYSLQAPALSSTAHAQALTPDYVISVQPVLIPEQVARPQIVVSASESAEVVPLNAALWAGPLEAQIRDALSDALTQRLKVVDIGLAKAVGTPMWQIYVDVQRFDSLYNRAVHQDVVWRLVPQGMSEEVGKKVCSAQFQLDVGTGMSALVAGHRRSLDLLADVVAQTLQGLSGSQAPDAAQWSQGGVNFRGCVG